jgi:hypothetical protein
VGGDRPCKYWNDLQNKLIAEGYGEVSEKVGQLKMCTAAVEGLSHVAEETVRTGLHKGISRIPSTLAFL